MNSSNKYIYQNSLSSLKLPKWAKSHSDIVNTFRSALESNHVSKNLHHWINLVFGYKSRGNNAELAFNLFDPLAYPENIDKINDTVSTNIY